jgi:hypothetical protein
MEKKEINYLVTMKNMYEIIAIFRIKLINIHLISIILIKILQY